MRDNKTRVLVTFDPEKNNNIMQASDAVVTVVEMEYDGFHLITRTDTQAQIPILDLAEWVNLSIWGDE